MNIREILLLENATTEERLEWLDRLLEEEGKNPKFISKGEKITMFLVMLVKMKALELRGDLD